MGFITVAPTASLPGLTMLSKDCVKWLDVETSTGSGAGGEAPRSRFVVFTGETLARLTRGAVRAPLHYVDETVLGQKRISAPFFLRGVSPGSSVLVPGCRVEVHFGSILSPRAEVPRGPP